MRESHKSINDLEYLHNMQCLNVHSDSAPVSDVQSSQQDRGLNWPVHINFRHVEVSNDEGRSKWGLSRGLSNSKYRRRKDREGFRQPHHHLKVFFYRLLIQGNFFAETLSLWCQQGNRSLINLLTSICLHTVIFHVILHKSSPLTHFLHSIDVWV